MYERVTACLLIVSLALAIALNLYLNEGKLPDPAGGPAYPVSPFIEITVKGAVAQPGTYQVEKGTPIAQVLEWAKPLENADLRAIKQNKAITRRRTINIKEKPQKKPQRNHSPSK